jgi:hypothetical protein
LAAFAVITEEENPAIAVAVQQPEVTAGELVDS